MSFNKRERRQRIRYRIRKRVAGTEARPRMNVYRSNANISVQLIDDVNGNTLVAASSLCKEIAEKKNITKTESANLVGKLIAQRALEKGITNVTFDRGGFLYHGRVKSLAEGAREGGLKF
ncbi:MAG TPA: 50S ribosomal protein L18 [Salinivirgaceae bacterium]|nr:50S ribosomal protein L18 [Salinivirgaceae bacterium]